jgi:hypothetical protein
MDESCKIRSIMQSLNQHISLNTQPKFTIQSSVSSAWQDLSKAYQDFENGEIRNLT